MLSDFLYPCIDFSLGTAEIQGKDRITTTRIKCFSGTSHKSIVCPFHWPWFERRELVFGNDIWRIRCLLGLEGCHTKELTVEQRLYIAVIVP